MTVSASIYTITVLAIDRLLAIKQPIMYRRVSNTQTALKLIIVIWIVSMAIMSPLLVMKKVDVITLIPGEPLYLCNEVWPSNIHRQIYDVIQFVFVYVTPGFAICCCYGLIGRELFREDKNLHRSESATSQGVGRTVMNSRKRVAKMLVVLAALFAFCWLPYYIVSLYLDFHGNEEPFLVILPFTILLGHANSAINPILYFYSSKSFRTYLIRTLTCKKKTNRRNLAVRYNTPRRKVRVEIHENAQKKPIIRVISSSALTRTRSTGDSFKFSRSSNTSCKSTNTHSRSRDSSREKTTCREKCKVKIDARVFTNIPPSSLNIKCQGKDKKYETIKAIVYPHSREIFDRKLSIPTTIHEESSRMSTVSPVRPPKHSPLVECITEQKETSGD